MLDVCLLGTGGMMPIPKRWLTSLLTRYNGSSLLIDCGEGTQVAMKQSGETFKPIDVICITHFHADHISGLPGFLLTMGNADRTEPVTIIGPKGIERVVNSLRVIAPELPFELKFIELEKSFESIELNGYIIEAFKVNHAVVCYGYTIKINRIGKFMVDNAKALGIPVTCWNTLQKGESVIVDGKEITPDMVLGPARKGIKLTYCTDSRPTASIIENAKDADLFICEGMYGEPEKESKARENKHMTFTEAARMAKEANVGELWLTHYSPALVRPKDYVGDARMIFEHTHVCEDGKSITLGFSDEG